MNILDIITVAIIFVCVVVCYVKGLLISVFNLLSFFISFMLTRKLYPYVGEWLRETPLFTSLYGLVFGWIGQNASVPDTGRIVTDTINNMSLPEIFKTLMADHLDSVPELDLTSAYEYISEFAAGLAVDAIAIVLVFIAVFIIMRVIMLLIKGVSNLPVVRTFNHVGGGFLGLIIGALMSWLVLSVMSGIFAAAPDFPVTDLLAESLIAKYFLFNL